MNFTIPNTDELLGRLNHAEREGIDHIGKVLAQNGFECYLVGGCVRDLLLNHHHPGDIDLTTNATPDTIQKLFHHTVPTGIDHGTMTIIFNRIGFEITTFRSESDYSDARRPNSIKFSKTLAEDLSRRDFTMNAICIDILNGKLIDLHDGQKDIKDKIVRTIGKAEDRFFEDGLRPIRACRFRSTLEFELDEGIKQALQNPQIHNRTSSIAVERFSDELLKGFGAKNPGLMITELEQSQLLYLFIKKADFNDIRPTKPTILDTLKTANSADKIYKLALWLQSIGIDSNRLITKFVKKLKLSQKQNALIIYYQLFVDFVKKINGLAEIKNHKTPKLDSNARLLIRHFLSDWKQKFGSDGLELLKAIPPNQWGSIPIHPVILMYKQDPLIIGDLDLNGNELKEIGFRGQHIGQTLRRLLDAVLENPQLNQKTRLRQMCQTWPKQSSPR